MIDLPAKHLLTLTEKMRGLIGASPVYPVYFTTRWGIHTFGVLSPIDVLILDNGLHVVKIRKGLPPNRIFFWLPVYEYVVELPPGEIEKRGIKRGDKIQLAETLSHRSLR